LISRIRSGLSYGNVIATLALFVALGGASYAVTHLKRNSVGPKQIRAGAVNTSELHKGAVKGSKLACPGGMTRTADLCYESQDRPKANWATAVDRCASAHLRLPTVDEAWLIAKQLPLPAQGSDDYLWTSVVNVLDAVAVKLVSGGIKPGTGSQSLLLEYRCVISAGA
jgi:hypothetical protein